jgi:hypothetical protein
MICPAARLAFGDILELFQGKCASVTISDKRYRYESFDEMKEHTGSRMGNLEIHGEQPHDNPKLLGRGKEAELFSRRSQIGSAAHPRPAFREPARGAAGASQPGIASCGQEFVVFWTMPVGVMLLY